MSTQKQHITIHDIAKKLGISASTVSRALKNNPRISESTRIAVRKEAEEYNYRPNAIAASLRKGKMNTVGVIVPNIDRSFFSNTIGGMEEILSEAGYNLMICQSNELFEKEKAAISTLLDARVDAIIMSLSMQTENYEHISKLIATGTKMIFFDRIPTSLPVHSVVINDYQAAYTLTKYVLKQGYKSPAHVGGSGKINVYANRKKGFLAAAKEMDIKVSPAFLIEEDMTLEGGLRAFALLEKGKYMPDVIICSGDFAALGVVLAARSRGIRIPYDLGISGFANEDFTRYITPPLTTIDQRGTDIGKAVAKKFLEMENPGKENQTIIEPQIIFRESTALRNNT